MLSIAAAVSTVPATAAAVASAHNVVGPNASPRGHYVRRCRPESAVDRVPSIVSHNDSLLSLSSAVSDINRPQALPVVASPSFVYFPVVTDYTTSDIDKPE